MSSDDVIRQAFADLDSDDVTTRIEAIQTLGRLKVKDAVSLLVGLLPDSIFGVEAAQALVEIASASVRDDTVLFDHPGFNAAKIATIEADEIVTIVRFSHEREWAYVRTDAGEEGWIWAALLMTTTPRIGTKPRQEFYPDVPGTSTGTAKEAKPDPEPQPSRDDGETRRGIPPELLEETEAELSDDDYAASEEEADEAVEEPKLEDAQPPKPIPSPGGAATDKTVQLSAYYPKEAAPNVWLPLRAYIYRIIAAPQVEEDAKQFLGDAAGSFRRAEDTARTDVQEGALVTATPELPGFQVNPPSISLLFLEDWHRFEFKLRATTAPLEQAANGHITFTVEGVIIADIPLSIFVSNSATNPTPAGGSSNPTATNLTNTTTKPYHSIFCSYSHKDTWIVERVEKAYKALGMDFLRDVVKLKSGQDWNAELLNMIDRADIFQLFWSSNAAQSKYVRQEWEYALKRSTGRTAFIRPVYWEQPMPPVPPELGHIHFAYQPELDD